MRKIVIALVLCAAYGCKSNSVDNKNKYDKDISQEIPKKNYDDLKLADNVLIAKKS